ncbi:DNA-processing protein DprA [Candidatus Latescibacterota bacterium]
MLTEEQKDILALYGVPGIGSQNHARLVAQFGSPAHVFRATKKELMLMNGIGEKTASNILSFERNEFVEDQIKRMDKAGATMLTRASENYPDILNIFKSAPPVLFIRGDEKTLLMDSIAFVGTRKPTDYGVRITRKMVAGCVEAGMSIVSGMAAGIDAASHRAALDNGGKTVAVFGCGVDIIYPHSNRKLSEDIIKSGCLVSHFPMGMKSLSGNFPARNAVITGLSTGTVVIEAPISSGALITAKLTLKAGRKLFIVPANADSAKSEGSNELIAKGALPVMQPNDILTALGKRVRITRGKTTVVVPDARPLPGGLSGKILEILKDGALQMETIKNTLGNPIHEISSELTMLEMDKFVIQKPGKVFERI